MKHGGIRGQTLLREMPLRRFRDEKRRFFRLLCRLFLSSSHGENLDEALIQRTSSISILLRAFVELWRWRWQIALSSLDVVLLVWNRREGFLESDFFLKLTFLAGILVRLVVDLVGLQVEDGRLFPYCSSFR